MNSLDRHDRAERVRDVREREQASARADAGARTLSKSTSPRLVDRNRPSACAPVCSHTSCHGTMLAWCSSAGDQDLVAGLQPRARVALRDQVDRFGRAADEDDLAASSRALMKPRTVSRAPS